VRRARRLGTAHAAAPLRTYVPRPTLGAAAPRSGRLLGRAYRGGRLEQRLAGGRDREGVVELPGLRSRLAGLPSTRRADFSADSGSGRTPRKDAAAMATVAAEAPRPAIIAALRDALTDIDPA
jgi:hypothetical protein